MAVSKRYLLIEKDIMIKLFKYIGLSASLSIACVQGAAAANDLFRCDRTYASDRGFKESLRGNSAFLNRTFPLELKIVIAENRSWAASYYGIQLNRGKNEKKYDVIRTKNGFQISGQKLRTTGEITVIFRQGGKKMGSPASYQCDKPKKTNWVPKD